MPHTRTLEAKATDATSQDIEEERRLFYVGVTRARQQLYLSRCRGRAQRGKPMPRTPSRFLADIPEDLVESMDVKEESSLSTGEMANSANQLLQMLDMLGKG